MYEEPIKTIDIILLVGLVVLAGLHATSMQWWRLAVDVLLIVAVFAICVSRTTPRSRRTSGDTDSAP